MRLPDSQPRQAPGLRPVPLLAAVVVGATCHAMFAQEPEAPSLDSGADAVNTVIERSVPFVLADLSPGAADAPLVLRFTTILFNGWFDATAPFHPSAVGVYSRLGRRPSEEATLRNLNVAILHASYRTLNGLLPRRNTQWRQILLDFGLDPDDASRDLTTPEGIGNVAGLRVVEGRANDGMNQFGNERRREHLLRPYSDYTGYEPVNTAYDLFNPSRWQPLVLRRYSGLFKIQNFVTPQYALVEPYSHATPDEHSVVPPASSDHRNYGPYKDQVDHVLTSSAGLTEERKLKAELFDNKIASLVRSALFAAESRDLPLLQTVHLLFTTAMATFDAGIFAWKEKRRHDAVRPFSAVRKVYGTDLVLAWGGPGEATLYMPGNHWRSYLEGASHPEYPSASACLCAAQAQAARTRLDDDHLGFSVRFPTGSSLVEPRYTPRADVTVTIPTWTDFSIECGRSRIWGGVSFRSAVEESRAVCGVFGDLADRYATRLISGTAARRGASRGR